MVTVIIPIYNEEKRIPELLHNLKELKGDFEVIFSDGFSKDSSYSIIKEEGNIRKIQVTKGRASQMNEAYKYSKGDYIWFLHGDSKVHRDSVVKIEESGADIGCFTLKFDSDNLLLKIIAFNSGLRVKLRNIAFGDQGIFIKRELFDEIGGYKNIPIMEDYELSINLKKRGYRYKLLPLTIITSSRRFSEKGILKTMIQMQYYQHLYRSGKDPQSIHLLYYGKD